MSAAKPMPVVILEWRPIKRNSLLGFVKLQLGALKISDVAINTSNGRTWANLPAKPQIDKEGICLRNEQGKIKYVPLIEWATREASDRFSESVIGALEERFPGSTAE